MEREKSNQTGKNLLLLLLLPARVVKEKLERFL
jgi:hypothetical protein